MKKWYTIENKAAERTAEITIFDSIGATWDGEGVTAKQFIADLKAIQADNITLLVNSPGGSVFDGLAIYAALRETKAKITGKVMGLAASAASFILMACERVVMPQNSFLMIHNPSTFAMGNADDMRETAAYLDKVGDSLVNIYATRTKQSVEDVKAWLKAETWFSATEAKDKGFADEVIDAFPATAQFEIDKLPENVRAAFASATPPAGPASKPEPTATVPLAEQIKALADAAGLPELAPVLAVASDVTTAEQAQAALALAADVKALCAVAGMPEKAKGLMASRKPLVDVRAELANAMAAASDKEIDTSVPSNAADPKKTDARIDTKAIYARENAKPTDKRSS